MGKETKCVGKVTNICFTCSQAVQSWYNEIKDYDYQKADAKTSGKQVLHFTQVSLLSVLLVRLQVLLGAKKKFERMTF
jgi:hypothetical protein